MDDKTELRAAVESGDVAALEALAARGVALDAKDEDERTPLHWASATGRADVAEFLVERLHARVNVQDDAGWTPLMSAASAGFAPVVALLLNSGADANLPNENGQIPLHYHRGRQEIAELLLDYTRDVNHVDDVGSTPLTRAIGGKPSIEVITLLLDHGAKVNTRDIAGNSPLHLAIMEGHESLAKFLVQHGANLNAKNNDKERCIDLAPRSLRAELTELARQAKAP